MLTSYTGPHAEFLGASVALPVPHNDDGAFWVLFEGSSSGPFFLKAFVALENSMSWKFHILEDRCFFRVRPGPAALFVATLAACFSRTPHCYVPRYLVRQLLRRYTFRPTEAWRRPGRNHVPVVLLPYQYSVHVRDSTRRTGPRMVTLGFCLFSLNRSNSIISGAVLAQT